MEAIYRAMDKESALRLYNSNNGDRGIQHAWVPCDTFTEAVHFEYLHQANRSFAKCVISKWQEATANVPWRCAFNRDIRLFLAGDIAGMEISEELIQLAISLKNVALIVSLVKHPDIEFFADTFIYRFGWHFSKQFIEVVPTVLNAFPLRRRHVATLTEPKVLPYVAKILRSRLSDRQVIQRARHLDRLIPFGFDFKQPQFLHDALREVLRPKRKFPLRYLITHVPPDATATALAKSSYVYCAYYATKNERRAMLSNLSRECARYVSRVIRGKIGYRYRVTDAELDAMPVGVAFSLMVRWGIRGKPHVRARLENLSELEQQMIRTLLPW
jgi:hypothetical protein